MLEKNSNFKSVSKNHIIDDDYIKKYIETTKAFILDCFSKWINETKKANIQLPQHIEKLEKMLSSVKYITPKEDIVNKYLVNENATMLRLAKHVYSQSNNLITNPKRVIFSFPEHKMIYSKDMGATYLFNNKLLSSIVDIISNDISKKISICEVGAGTGGLTKYFLPVIYDQALIYTITDTSKFFTKTLKKELLSFNNKTEYEIWNIMEPKEKTIVSNYDLIVASNVIHAALNIEVAISNIFHALTDHGYFLLHETTHGYASSSAIWGFMEDLWKFTDNKKRSDGAFLSIDNWCTTILSFGFELIQINDDECLQTMFLFKKSTNIFKGSVK
ncbi:methyltransferase [Sulfurimonas sp.]|uniref:class I SAM-dependent methyltransferase n=1 Tax=Sulfurimonas sp. TaxID=2022749 RepID=UPI00262CFBD0|nr:methyltransferase [Sulfurimonas sp.]